MPKLKWTRPTTFLDGNHDVQVHGTGVYDVPEEAVEEYLDHRTGAWERPGEDDDEEDAEEQSDGDDDEENNSPGPSDFTELERVGDATADALQNEGFETFEDLEEATVGEIANADGVTESVAENIHSQLDEEGGDPSTTTGT